MRWRLQASCDLTVHEQGVVSIMSYEKDLQDAFLNHVRSEHLPVTVFLINGVKLQGKITWFDSYCLLLKRDSISQLVYKHAVSTVMPSKSVRLYDGEEVDETDIEAMERERVHAADPATADIDDEEADV